MRKAPSAFTNGRKSTHLLSPPTSGSTQRLGDGGIRTCVAAEGAGEQASASRRRRDANVAKHALQDRDGWLRQNPMLDDDHGEAPASVVQDQHEPPRCVIPIDVEVVVIEARVRQLFTQHARQAAAIRTLHLDIARLRFNHTAATEIFSLSLNAAILL